MAAAYETGSALGGVDLLQKLVTFMTAQGWAVNLSAADGAGWRAHLNKAGIYANFRAYTGADAINDVSPGGSGSASKAGICFYLGSGYSGASPWHSQAGGALADGVNKLRPCMWLNSDSVLGYHFLDDGSDHVIVEVESIAGVHVYLGFGLSIDKAGAWTGGEYYFASAAVYNLDATGGAAGWGLPANAPFGMGGPSAGPLGTWAVRAFVRADVDAYASEWVGMGSVTAGGGAGYIYGYTGLLGSTDVPGGENPNANVPGYENLIPYTGNSFNGRTVLLPAHCYTERQAGGYSLLGTLPDVFVGYGDFSPGEIYSIGAEDYLAFPTYTARYCWFVRKRA